MGMFDTIEFNIDLLPVSQFEKELLAKEEFQTKSLRKALLKYRITENGHLEYLEYSTDFLKNYDAACAFEHWIGVPDIHGYLNIYTLITETNSWYEFKAKFNNGKLVEIFRVEA